MAIADHPDPQPMSATRAAGGGREPLDQAGNAGEPFLGQQIDEHGPVDPGDKRAQLFAVGAEGNSVAGPERAQDVGDGSRYPGESLAERGQEGQAVWIDQDLRVARRQSEARFGGSFLHDQDARHGLLFEPLLGVAFVDAAPLGQFCAGKGAIGSKHPIKTQLVPHVHVQEVERADTCL